MADQTLPPGYRFSPTDQELLGYCLRNKISGVALDPRVAGSIMEAVFYGTKDGPEQVYAKFNISERDCLRDEFYFFTFVKKKFSTGKGNHMGRSAGKGNWKSMGHPTPVHDEASGALLGKKLTLNFQINNKNCTPSWIMHEYTMPNSSNSDHWAICRVLRGNQNSQDLPSTCNINNKRTMMSSDYDSIQSHQYKKKQCVASNYELSNMCSASSSQSQHYLRPPNFQPMPMPNLCQTFEASTSSSGPPTETTGEMFQGVINDTGFAAELNYNLVPQLPTTRTTCMPQQTIGEGQLCSSSSEPSTLLQPTELLTSRTEVPVEPLSQCGSSENSISPANDLFILDEIFADLGSNNDFQFQLDTLNFLKSCASEDISEFQNSFVESYGGMMLS